ncbi:MAG: hypothetical protein ACOX1N_00010 [Candidatus Methanomethylophilaceae archaeon]
MTGFNGKKRENLQTAYLIPIVTILLSGFLFIGIGFAGVTSSVEVSGNVGTSDIIVHLEDEEENYMVPGDFSSGKSLKYTLVGSNYNIYAGNFELGNATLVIDATNSVAESISLSTGVKYKFENDSNYINGLPYNLTPRFVIKDSSGVTITDLSEISINAGENRFSVVFFGDLSQKFDNGTDVPDNFYYQVLFGITPL